MNKNLITYVAIATIALVPAVSFAADASPSPVASPASTSRTSASSGAPATDSSTDTGTSNTGGSSSSGAPSTDTSASTGRPPTDTSASSGLPPTGSSESTGSPSSPVTPPPAPASTGGGTVNSSGGGSSGSSHRYGSFITGSCELITSYMKLGNANDASQVAKLQAFLKNTEKLDVAVTGIFDAKTDAAVRAFQNKYLATVMGPWGVNQASGYVYITTSKMINKISCNQPLTLNASELAIINSFRNGKTVNTVSTETEVTPGVTPVTPATPTDVNSVPTDNTEVGSTDDKAANTANVGQASILRRFWNFIVYLFR